MGSILFQLHMKPIKEKKYRLKSFLTKKCISIGSFLVSRRNMTKMSLKVLLGKDRYCTGQKGCTRILAVFLNNNHRNLRVSLEKEQVLENHSNQPAI